MNKISTAIQLMRQLQVLIEEVFKLVLAILLGLASALLTKSLSLISCSQTDQEELI